MLLSRSVALSILAALGANTMIIPNVGDVIDTFKGSGLLDLKNAVGESAKHLGALTEAAGSLVPSGAASRYAEFEQKISA